MDGICKFCGKSIWMDTDGWRHDSTGTMPICNSKPEPREGKTLADFANRPELLQDDAGRIYDVNGNNVGYWSADEVEPEEEDGEDEDDDEEEE